MELWDLYDKDRKPLGRTHLRGTPLAPGEYHLAVIVVIVNKKGQVLLTRRAAEKDLCPGWWENTGGSVLAGETSLEAIRRELREETGLLARREELTLLLQENCRAGTHFDIYALTWEGEPADIRFQPGETDAARWVSLRQWEQVAGTEGTLCPARRAAYRQELYRRVARYCQGWREFPPMEGPPSELWDLYDKDRKPLGRTVERGAPLPEGTYHLAVQIAPLNSRGEILLTRRADSKPKYPGCWEIPGGCAKAGEDSPTAACRELLEETGIAVGPATATAVPTCTPSPRTSPLHSCPSSPGRPTKPSGSPWRPGWSGWGRETTSPPAGSPPWTALSTQNCSNTETECSILPHKERRATWHTK